MGNGRGVMHRRWTLVGALALCLLQCACGSRDPRFDEARDREFFSSVRSLYPDLDHVGLAGLAESEHRHAIRTLVSTQYGRRAWQALLMWNRQLPTADRPGPGARRGEGMAPGVVNSRPFVTVVEALRLEGRSIDCYFRVFGEPRVSSELVWRLVEQDGERFWEYTDDRNTPRGGRIVHEVPVFTYQWHEDVYRWPQVPGTSIARAGSGGYDVRRPLVSIGLPVVLMIALAVGILRLRSVVAFALWLAVTGWVAAWLIVKRISLPTPGIAIVQLLHPTVGRLIGMLSALQVAGMVMGVFMLLRGVVRVACRITGGARDVRWGVGSLIGVVVVELVCQTLAWRAQYYTGYPQVLTEPGVLLVYLGAWAIVVLAKLAQFTAGEAAGAGGRGRRRKSKTAKSKD